MHQRFLRLFINGAIRVMSSGEMAKTPLLFLLDEFYSLGTMRLLEEAAGRVAGYNVKLWPIIQNLSQLIELYPKNWESFFANAGTLQVFAVNDLTTEDFIVRKLGKAVTDIKVGDHLQRVVVQLREAAEVEQEVARGTMRQIVFRQGKSTLLLRRMNYDKSFRRNQYNRDPDILVKWWQWRK